MLIQPKTDLEKRNPGRLVRIQGGFPAQEPLHDLEEALAALRDVFPTFDDTVQSGCLGDPGGGREACGIT